MTVLSCAYVAVDSAAEDMLVIKAGTIYLAPGQVLGGGGIVVRDGRIHGIGSKVEIPSGATVIDLPNGSITAGLIDAAAFIEPTDLVAPSERDSLAPVEEESQTVWQRHVEPLLEKKHRSLPFAPTCPDSEEHEEDEECEICGGAHADALDVGTRWGVSLAESSSEVVPHTRAIDAIDLDSPDFARLARSGVTTVYVASDPAAVIGSRGAIVRTAGPMDERVMSPAAAVGAAMGTDPSWSGRRNRPPNWRNFGLLYARRPTTRMGVAWVFRKAFHEARALASGDLIGGADTPSTDALAILRDVLDGEIPLRIQARKQHDILTAMRLTEEFNLTFTLEEATEAYACVDELSSRKTPVIFGPIYVQAPGMRRFSAETDDPKLHTVRALLDAGVTTAITARELRDEDGLARQAMYAMRCGLSFDEALACVTTTPAKLLGIENEVGQIAPGKRCDLVVWSGKPFDAVSRPLVVVSDGRVVADNR